jgi:hypothetical protein
VPADVAQNQNNQELSYDSGVQPLTSSKAANLAPRGRGAGWNVLAVWHDRATQDLGRLCGGFAGPDCSLGVQGGRSNGPTAEGSDFQSAGGG